MPVNKSEQSFFEILTNREKENPSKPITELTVEEFRAGSSLFLEFGGKAENVAIENRLVPARDGHQIPIRIFNSDIKTTGPVLIMYPSGGYVMNTFEANAIACSRIAKYSGRKIILVDYRLVPENPMPIPILDAFDATLYIATHANEFSLAPEKLVVGGFSAGAHCAAAISNLAQNNQQLKINQQILLNGTYNALLRQRDYAEYEAQDKMVSREGLDYIYGLWKLTEAEFRSPIYSPYCETNFDKLPKTTFIIGEFDGVRSDSELYFEKLKSAGCQVNKILLPGQCHHTILLRGFITNGEDPAKIIAQIFMKV